MALFDEFHPPIAEGHGLPCSAGPCRDDIMDASCHVGTRAVLPPAFSSEVNLSADALLLRMHERSVAQLARTCAGDWHSLWQNSTIAVPPGASDARRAVLKAQDEADRLAIRSLVRQFKVYVKGLDFVSHVDGETGDSVVQPILRECGVVVGADGSRQRFALLRVRNASAEPLIFWERYGFNYPRDASVYLQLLEKKAVDGDQYRSERSDGTGFTIRVFMSPEAWNYDLRALRASVFDYASAGASWSGDTLATRRPNERPWAWNVLLTALATNICEAGENGGVNYPFQHEKVVNYEALESSLRVTGFDTFDPRSAQGAQMLSRLSPVHKALLVPYQAATDMGSRSAGSTFAVTTNYGQFVVGFYYNPDLGDVNFRCSNITHR